MGPMKATFFDEPELEFGSGSHIDIRFGLMNYGPLDFEKPIAPKKINVGIVGTPETVEGVTSWLERCRTGIVAKPSQRPNLFPRFPGFGEDSRLCADLICDSQLQRFISSSRLDNLCRQPYTGSV